MAISHASSTGPTVRSPATNHDCGHAGELDASGRSRWAKEGPAGALTEK